MKLALSLLLMFLMMPVMVNPSMASENGTDGGKSVSGSGTSKKPVNEPEPDCDE